MVAKFQRPAMPTAFSFSMAKHAVLDRALIASGSRRFRHLDYFMNHGSFSIVFISSLYFAQSCLYYDDFYAPSLLAYALAVHDTRLPNIIGRRRGDAYGRNT